VTVAVTAAGAVAVAVVAGGSSTRFPIEAPASVPAPRRVRDHAMRAAARTFPERGASEAVDMS